MNTQKIDDALDRILRASGSSLKNYTMQKTLDDMRWEMIQIIKTAYFEGADDCFKSFTGKN